MASPLYLTLLAGPMVPLPVPKPVTDAFVAAEVTESATGESGFQLNSVWLGLSENGVDNRHKKQRRHGCDE